MGLLNFDTAALFAKTKHDLDIKRLYFRVQTLILFCFSQRRIYIGVKKVILQTQNTNQIHK